MNYQYPAVGAVIKNDQVHFTVWAPLREQVEVVLDNQTLPMTRDERGYWTASVEGGEGLRYLYRLDKDRTFPDPASRFQPEGVHGKSQVVSDKFKWTDAEWKGIPLGEMVLYEIHPGTFTNEGTFSGIISKLPYLKDLGINAIELMPIAQFPGSRNWGYDGVYPYAVQDSYGGVQELKQLVDTAHQLGIAVILDVVYNHLGPEGNYFSEFGPYFTDKYRTGWGRAINFDDAWCDGVRNFFWQNALMWLDEFHIDGLRLDAVHAIWDVGVPHFIDELTKRVRALEQSTGRKKVLIAEFDLNNPRYISSPEKGGYGLDGQWIDEFHHALHSVVTGEVDGYYEDFGRIEHLTKSLKHSYVYTGEYSIHRKKTFGTYPYDNTYDQFVVFAQNHDQVGNRMLGDRLAQSLNFEQLKITAAAYLLAPQVPMLFMGEEYGETNPFQYFISHTDPELVEIVRKGRKEEFSYFKWQGEVPDPQSEDTFNQCKLSWAFHSDQQRKTLLEFYRTLISFRRTRVAMKGKHQNEVDVFDTNAKKIIAFTRTFEGDRVIVAINFEKSQQTLSLDGSETLQKIIDSSSHQWGGPGELTPNQLKSNQHIVLNPLSVVVFETEK